MLLQTNSYIVPKHQRVEHAQLLDQFRHAMARLGCDSFEVYEQVGANWNPDQSDGRFVQLLRFRDRAHQQAVRDAERLDLQAQSLIEDFCRLINFPYQKEHGVFAVGFYTELQNEQPIAGPVSAFPAGANSPVVPDEIPPNEGELDELLHHQFGPSARPDGESSEGDPEIARVLDAGLAFDELDIPMEAELLDDQESDKSELAPTPAPQAGVRRHLRK